MGHIFLLKNLKYQGWQYREHIKTLKNGGFCEEWLSEDDFEAVSATFCCYDYRANASEAVQKKPTDKKSIKTYRSKKVSQMLLVCYNLLNSQKCTYQSITKL